MICCSRKGTDRDLEFWILTRVKAFRCDMVIAAVVAHGNSKTGE